MWRLLFVDVLLLVWVLCVAVEGRPLFYLFGKVWLSFDANNLSSFVGHSFLRLEDGGGDLALGVVQEVGIAAEARVRVVHDDPQVSGDVDVGLSSSHQYLPQRFD